MWSKREERRKGGQKKAGRGPWDPRNNPAARSLVSFCLTDPRLGTEDASKPEAPRGQTETPPPPPSSLLSSAKGQGTGSVARQQTRRRSSPYVSHTHTTEKAVAHPYTCQRGWSGGGLDTPPCEALLTPSAGGCGRRTGGQLGRKEDRTGVSVGGRLESLGPRLPTHPAHTPCQWRPRGKWP